MGVNLHPAASTLATPTRANNTRTGRSSSSSSNNNNNNNNNNSNGRGARKRKFGISDLPFVHWDVDSRKWRVSFIPLLLAWAGTQRDPFGTNSQMADEVTTLWECVYPAIVLNDARLAVILSVVRAFPEPISI
jgi:hypothetical protein